MRRSAILLGVSVAACALAATGERDAAACGGCFHPPAQVASDITDERMLLSVSTSQTTLYDQIRYEGSPASFAWVLPIHGTVDVGLSADVLFDAVDTLTATQIPAPPPPITCVQPQSGSSSGGGFGAATAVDAGAAGGVTVTKQENVGPYATVQLHATDSSALAKWLADNGFQIPSDVQPTIDAYVSEGFDFLAMKLLPNEGVQAMRPVRVTMGGASLSLPLRMAAVGTGATVGITIWVVADGRYEPSNFPFFHIEDKDLVWDFATSSSNYTTLRAQNEANLAGKGWELESSIAVNEQTISNVILSGGLPYYGGTGYQSDASADYLPVPADPDAGADAGAGESADQVRTEDIATLFAGMAGPTVRVTRMRSDISHAAMTTDFVLQASSDQSEIPNVRTVAQSVNFTCPNGTTPGGAPGDGSSGSSGSSGGGGTFSCVTSPRASMRDFGAWAVCGVLGAAAVASRVRRRRKNDRAKR